MCNVLPKQSTGLFRRICTTRFYMLLVGENSYVSQTNFVCLPDPHPFSAFWRLAVLPHGVTARQRAEYPHFVRRFRLTATRAPPLTCKGDASPLTPD